MDHFFTKPNTEAPLSVRRFTAEGGKHGGSAPVGVQAHLLSLEMGSCITRTP